MTTDKKARTKAMGALKALVEDDTAETARAAAEAVVALRATFVHDGLPDWAGRSLDYRMEIERLYRDAGVPSDSVAPTLAKLRYHVGNVVRERAPAAELVALGLRPEGPRKRNKERRATVSRLPARRPSIQDFGVASSEELAVGLLDHALSDVRLLRQALPDQVDVNVVSLLQALISEAVDVLQEATA